MTEKTKASEQFHKLRSRDSGAAMIVVVCVLMITMIICLTMIVGAYQMVSSVGDTRRDSVNEQQAVSFLSALNKQIETVGAPVPATETDLATAIATFAAKTAFTDLGDGKYNEPTRSLIAQHSDTTPAAWAPYSDIRLILRKQWVSSDKCKLFITAEILEGDRVCKTCCAGYDVKINTDDTYEIAFKAFY